MAIQNINPTVLYFISSYRHIWQVTSIGWATENNTPWDNELVISVANVSPGFGTVAPKNVLKNFLYTTTGHCPLERLRNWAMECYLSLELPHHFSTEIKWTVVNSVVWIYPFVQRLVKITFIMEDNAAR